MITTNEWIPVSEPKWVCRTVLCRYKDGHYETAAWNGAYWTYGGVRIADGDKITHFYVFERFHRQNA